MRLKKHQIYLIRWRDHYSTDGWVESNLEDVEDNMELSTVGFYIKKTTHHLHFSRTLGNDNTLLADIMSIMEDQILEIVPLYKGNYYGVG
jgi:hypothetical protein